MFLITTELAPWGHRTAVLGWEGYVELESPGQGFTGPQPPTPIATILVITRKWLELHLT